MSAAITDTTSASARNARRVRGLYAITPDLADTAQLAVLVQAAMRGGARVLQYRNKAADAALRREQALAIKHALAATAALLIINDDVTLAATINAHGAHIGEDDPDVAQARSLLGPNAIIGVSCYNDIARARELVADGANYVAFGSFYSSTVKPGARRADVALLHDASQLGVPVVAIGGITAENAGALRDAGADAVAVISAVFGSGDPVRVERDARAIARVFDD